VISATRQDTPLITVLRILTTKERVKERKENQKARKAKEKEKARKANPEKAAEDKGISQPLTLPKSRSTLTKIGIQRKFGTQRKIGTKN
jgi:hypothetical protein